MPLNWTEPNCGNPTPEGDYDLLPVNQASTERGGNIGELGLNPKREEGKGGGEEGREGEEGTQRASSSYAPSGPRGDNLLGQATWL